LSAGLGDHFYRVRKAAWDNLAVVPGILGRFCETQQALLRPYLSEVEAAVALIDKGTSDDALGMRAEDVIARLRPDLGRIERQFLPSSLGA
jgi:hypothetical protein